MSELNLNFRCTHGDKAAMHTALVPGIEEQDRLGVGTMDVEGTACATGLLPDLLADVRRALHGNTSEQETETPCLKQAGS